MPHLQLQATDGFALDAYRAEPTSAPRGGVVVTMEIFGVNAHIRAVADRFAAAGYLAIAPALFDRVERRVELGYDAAGVTRGRELVGALDQDALLCDVAAAVAAASGAGAVGAVGYCFGGAVVWAAAARLEGLACAVSYYGSRIAQMTDLAPRVPVMMHVGIHDASFPLETVRGLGVRYPSVIIHEYDAGHGFNCDQRADHRPEAAALALDRTLAFFGEHLG
jgi:carboxymethylenebutenolidase